MIVLEIFSFYNKFYINFYSLYNNHALRRVGTTKKILRFMTKFHLPITTLIRFKLFFFIKKTHYDAITVFLRAYICGMLSYVCESYISVNRIDLQKNIYVWVKTVIFRHLLCPTFPFWEHENQFHFWNVYIVNRRLLRISHDSTTIEFNDSERNFGKKVLLSAQLRKQNKKQNMVIFTLFRRKLN